MKTALLLFVAGIAPMFAADGGQLTDAERTFLVDQMEQTKTDFLQSIAGLTPDQWKFKAAPERWSVAECAEHIVLSESNLFQGSQDMLKIPATPRAETSSEEVDKKLAMGVRDRSHTLKAPEPLVPSGKYATPADAAKAFTEKRDQNIAYVKTTKDDLRVHITDGPVGKMDAYQLLVLMAAHSARHTLQIREVEADAKFPKAAVGTK